MNADKYSVTAHRSVSLTTIEPPVANVFIRLFAILSISYFILSSRPSPFPKYNTPWREKQPFFPMFWKNKNIKMNII